MIKSISIENFRCFENTKIKDFGLINLIGGKNNSGKTVLLEAILIKLYGNSEPIEFLQNIRGEDEKTRTSLGDKAWDTLFFMQNSNKKIYISSTNKDIESTTTIYCEKNETNIISLIEKSPDPKVLEFGNLSTNKNNNILYIKDKFSDIENTSFIILNSNGLINKNILQTTRNIVYMPSIFRSSHAEMARLFDIVYEQGLYQEIISSLQIIDSSIKHARTSTSSGTARVVLAREDHKFIPINLFGDAMSKILDITLTMINIPDGFLLIDEIENGIHHTNQKEFWRNIITLAKTFNVQVFATTHSQEMIKALNDIALGSEYEKEIMYFELIRHSKTNKIKGLAIDMETLQTKLLTNSPYRGE